MSHVTRCTLVTFHMSQILHIYFTEQEKIMFERENKNSVLKASRANELVQLSKHIPSYQIQKESLHNHPNSKKSKPRKATKQAYKKLVINKTKHPNQGTRHHNRRYRSSCTVIEAPVFILRRNIEIFRLSRQVLGCESCAGCGQQEAGASSRAFSLSRFAWEPLWVRSR